MVGRVVSNRMQKTVVVEIKRTTIHPRYRKVLRKVTRLKAHDETNACRIGDLVRLHEARPLSREKRWRVAEVVSRAAVVE